MTYNYNAFGLDIQTDLNIVGLEESNPSPSNRKLRVCLNRAEPSVEPLELQFGDKNPLQSLFWPEIARFDIDAKGTIDIYPCTGIAQQVLNLPLYGTVISTFLHMTGRFVLHANAVKIGQHHVAFAGDKGAGKSTTSAAAVLQGCDLISDDVVALDLASAKPQVMPGIPIMKLFPDIAEKLTSAQVQFLPLPAPEFPKRLVKVGGVPADIRPELDALIFLSEGKSLQLHQIPAPRALQSVIKFSHMVRLSDYGWSNQERAGFFTDSAKLANSVPNYQLEVPRDLDRLADLIAFIDQGLIGT
ncbi:MAG: hypothetical protein ACK5SF_07425 [Hyphomonadaceae bacterium]|jgi:hypothetical protein